MSKLSRRQFLGAGAVSIFVLFLFWAAVVSHNYHQYPYDCRDPFDCSLNGECGAGSKCQCYVGWTGTHCQTLDLEPALNGSGLQSLLYQNRTSSWGGSVLVDDEGVWHMWYSEITHHCGIHRWLTNSQVVHAINRDGSWRFTPQEVVFPIFAHEPIVARTSDGMYVMYLTLNPNGKASDEPTCHCEDGNSNSGREKGCYHEASGSRKQEWYRSYMTYSESPYGPWAKPQSLGHIDPGIHVDLNLAPVIHANGSALFWTRWNVWYADDWKNVSTYRDLGQAPDFSHNSTWEGEDPSMWIDRNGHYHILSHNGPRGKSGLDGDCGRHLFSVSGLPGTWRLSYQVSKFGGCAYPRRVPWQGAKDRTFYRRERPHLIFNQKGQPVALSTAVIDDPSGPNKNDPESQRDASFALIQAIRGSSLADTNNKNTVSVT